MLPFGRITYVSGRADILPYTQNDSEEQPANVAATAALRRAGSIV